LYVFASRYFHDGEDHQLQAQLGQHCKENGYWPVDMYIDRGPPKGQFSDYPVLQSLVTGDAEALVVVRTPGYRRDGVADWLEATCPAGSFVRLWVAELCAEGLLPASAAHRSRARRTAAQSPGAPPVRAKKSQLPQPRSLVALRAKALRTQGLDLRQI